jgi:hypothetical protein
MRIKTNELSGAALDWAVAKCEGHHMEYFQVVDAYLPSTDWAQGGPIIEREEIGIKRNSPCSDGRQWEASPSITAKGAGGKWGYGPTPLIAAMRCYATSKLGDDIDIPEELTP